MERERVVTWQDPMPIAAAAVHLDGAEFWRGVQRGDIPAPPIAHLLGFAEIVEVDRGRIVFRLEPGEHLYNPIGVVHGGVAATLLDSAMGCAVHTTLPAGVGYTTLELKVNFVRPVLATTGPVLAEGTLVHGGGTIATTEARLVAERDGRLLAHATSTCMVLRAEQRAAA